MKKKKWYQCLKNWVWIAGIPTALGAIILLAKVITTYAELPKEVEATQKDVSEIQQYIQQQQAINDYYYRKEHSEEVVSPDGKWVWDEQNQEWKPKRSQNDR